MNEEKKEVGLKKLISQILNQAKKLKKSPVVIEKAAGTELIKVMSDDLSIRELIQDAAVMKIIERQERKVALIKETDDEINSIIDGVQEELAKLVGAEAKEETFNWLSANGLYSVVGSVGSYGVPNERFHLAKQKFKEMAEKASIKKEFLNLADAAFTVTKAGRTKDSEIRLLLRSGFTEKEYAGWDEVKDLLQTCIDDRKQKMRITVSKRENLKSNLKVITDK